MTDHPHVPTDDMALTRILTRGELNRRLGNISRGEDYHAVANEVVASHEALREAAELQHEVCVCAAIRMPDGYVIRGHRHNDCLRVAAGLRVPTGVHPHDYVRRYSQQEIQAAPQGFYTTRERFVDRADGLTLQIAAGRRSADAIAGGGPGGFRWQLYSEDLY